MHAYIRIRAGIAGYAVAYPAYPIDPPLGRYKNKLWDGTNSSLVVHKYVCVCELLGVARVFQV
jgi:hypothetical protein